MNDEVPPCHGEAPLFDSTHWPDHLLARAFCKDAKGRPVCPRFDTCRTDYQTLRLETITVKDGGPQGTWAGVLYGIDSKPIYTPRHRRSDATT